MSVYGLGRFPVTLYCEQWTRLLGAAGDLRAFLEENKGRLKLKGETGKPSWWRLGKAMEPHGIQTPCKQPLATNGVPMLRFRRAIGIGAVRSYYLSRPKLVEGVLTVITADHPVIRKTREQIDREKAKSGKEKVAARG